MKRAWRRRTVCARYQTQEVDRRNETEAQWGVGTYIEATIIVYGWFKPGTHDLWPTGREGVRALADGHARSGAVRHLRAGQRERHEVHIGPGRATPGAGASGVVPATPLAGHAGV